MYFERKVGTSWNLLRKLDFLVNTTQSISDVWFDKFLVLYYATIGRSFLYPLDWIGS